MNPLLSVKDLHVTFRVQKQPLKAVRGVSFDLYEEEILGIVGESGCGKSATAKALVRLLPAHSSIISGEVIYKGENLLSFDDRKMQKMRGKEIGMIFQDPMTSLNPTMKIGDQIIEGYLHHTETRFSQRGQGLCHSASRAGRDPSGFHQDRSVPPYAQRRDAPEGNDCAGLGCET